MKHIRKNISIAITLLSIIPLHGLSTTILTPVLTYLKPRPQGFDGPLKISGEFGTTHKWDETTNYQNITITPTYAHTWNSTGLAHGFFGNTLNFNAGCNTLRVQGSTAQNSNRNITALFADYFYLPTDFEGTLSFNPHITNFLIEFNYYCGLDHWYPGTYIRLYAPFVHTTWNLDMRESTENPGTAQYRAGYFTPTTMNRSLMLNNARDFFAGRAPNQTNGVTFHGLCFNKIDGAPCGQCSNGARTKNGLGEIRSELGWNFLRDENYHLGFNLQVAIPTGTRPDAEYLFEPIVGNGKHWELGGGLTGHYTFWYNEDSTKQWSINGDMSVLHLCSTKQRRTFDLRGNPLSRYMLAAKYSRVANTDDPNTLKGDLISALFTFANEYTPVANLTTRDVHVSVSAQLDLTVWFNYTSDHMSWDIGYDLWFSGREKIDPTNACPPCSCCPVQFEENRWAVKGDAQMFGFQAAGGSTGTTDMPLPLSASNSKATILSGSNTLASGNPQFTNGRIDRPKLATENGTNVNNQTSTATGPLPFGGAQQIFTSIQTALITQQQLNNSLNDSLNRGLSNKVFTSLEYTWHDYEYDPRLLFGVSAEFGKTHNGSTVCPTKLIVNTSTCCPTALITNSTGDCPAVALCPDSINCALSQWSIWIKGGITF